MPLARPRLYAPLFAAFILAIVALSARSASATVCAWNVPNGDWNVSGNWTCLLVPGAGDTAIINNGGTVAATTDVSVLNLNLTNGTLTGPGALTVEGAFSWVNGTITSTVAGAPIVLVAGSAMTMSASANLNGRVLTNHGAARWTAGSPSLANGAIFNNASDGSFEIASPPTEFLYSPNSATFNNAGRLTKTSAGNTIIFPSLNNSGALTLTAGSLELRANGTSSGSFEVQAGTTFEFRLGTNVLDAGARIQGAGTVKSSGSTTVISGTYNLSNTVVSLGSLTLATGQSVLLDQLTVMGGELTLSNGQAVTINRLNAASGWMGGNDPLTVTNTFNWGSGSITTTVPGTPIVLLAGSAMTMSGSAHLYGRVLANYGTAIWTGGSPILYNGAVFNNASIGTLNLAATGPDYWYTSSGAVFNNAGTVNRNVASVMPWYVPILNTGNFNLVGAVLQINATYTQTSGETNLSSAAIGKTGGPIALQGGQLRGTGVITANLSHQGGVVAPGGSAGVLKLVGNYVQSPGAHLAIEIGGLTSGTQYDVFDVTGSAAISGTLSLSTLNAFVPALGNTFRVMNYGSRTGGFAAVLSGNTGSGFALKPRYYADNVTLEVWRLLFLPLIVR